MISPTVIIEFKKAFPKIDPSKFALPEICGDLEEVRIFVPEKDKNERK